MLTRSADLRYHGQGFELRVDWSADTAARFHQLHARRYGYEDPARQVEIVTLRVQAVVRTERPRVAGPKRVRAALGNARIGAHRVFEDGRWRAAALYDRSLLRTGDRVTGPAVIVELSATTYVARGWKTALDAQGNLCSDAGEDARGDPPMKKIALDPAAIAVVGYALHSVAVEMGAALRRTAFSPNIKERRDYSSAVFSGDGDLIAMGDDMPVHLGSMPMSVRAALDAMRLVPGDVALLNDPYRGGTHLPDHHDGGAGLCGEAYAAGILRCKSRASCGCGRHASGIDGPVPRDRAGRDSDSSGEAGARGRDGCASAGDSAGQRAHPPRTRRRPYCPAGRMPHRDCPHAGAGGAVRVRTVISGCACHARRLGTVDAPRAR